MIHEPGDPSSPPEIGEINFSVGCSPVSLQGSPQARVRFRNEIRRVTAPALYLLSGEVQVEVEWYLPESIRYRGNHSPDVDNVMKPLLDSLTGPDGLMINDCQVQAVACHWIDWGREDQQLDVRLKYIPDLHVAKNSLSFVDIGANRCIPINDHGVADYGIALLNLFENAFQSYERLLASGSTPGTARHILPIQRPFSRGRLVGFVVCNAEEYRARQSQSE